MTHEDQDNTVNRRSVLKKLGATGAVGATGIPARVSAEENPSSARVKSTLAEPQVHLVRDKIGSFSVNDTSVKKIEKEGKTITVTEIQTDRGTLTNTEIGSTVEAKLELDLSQNPELQQKLPAGFGPVPDGSTVSLIGDESSAAFGRMATDDELKQLERAVGDSVIAAVYTSDINGFRVAAGTVSEETTDVQRYHVGVNGGDISPETVEPMMSAQGCTQTCMTCAIMVIRRGACYTSCIGAVSGWGIAACVACIMYNNLNLGYSCGNCINCFT